MLAATVAHPVLCVLGWVLLGRMSRKRLRSYVAWSLPGVIGATLTTAAILLLAFVTLFDRRAYALGALSYLLTLVGMVFNVVGFARLWRTVAGLPPAEGGWPPAGYGAPQEGVWPPPPSAPLS